MDTRVQQSQSAITKRDTAKIKKLITWYNMVPNVIWSALHLTPVSIFCYHFLSLSMLYSFLSISLLAIFLPKSFFLRIQLAKTISLYKKTGVAFINKFTQNGTIINGLIKKKVPGYKVVFTSKHSVNKLLQQAYMFEKFHFILFIFFNLTIAYALIKSHFGWTVIILITNLAYNVYPLLLQQYIRIRLTTYTESKQVIDNRQ